MHRIYASLGLNELNMHIMAPNLNCPGWRSVQHQAIIWSNGGLIYWLTYGLLSLCELSIFVYVFCRKLPVRVHFVLMIHWELGCNYLPIGFVDLVQVGVMTYSTWWRHQMETFSVLLAICVGNSPVPSEFIKPLPEPKLTQIYVTIWHQ